MLMTKLEHIETEEEIKDLINNNENVMICCGRMGPMCMPVYGIMMDLRDKYSHVQFRDMEFDIPGARFIRELPECSNFMGLPFTVYFKNGKVAKATSSIQTAEQVRAIIDEKFGKSQ